MIYVVNELLTIHLLFELFLKEKEGRGINCCGN